MCTNSDVKSINMVEGTNTISMTKRGAYMLISLTHNVQANIESIGNWILIFMYIWMTFNHDGKMEFHVDMNCIHYYDRTSTIAVSGIFRYCYGCLQMPNILVQCQDRDLTYLFVLCKWIISGMTVIVFIELGYYHKLEDAVRNIPHASPVPCAVRRSIVYMFIFGIFDWAAGVVVDLNMWRIGDALLPSLLGLEGYVSTMLLWLPRATTVYIFGKWIADDLCEETHGNIYMSRMKKHVIWGEQTILVTNVQELMYDTALHDWVAHPVKPFVNGLQVLKVMHDLDRKMCVAFRRMISYQVPRTFMDGELNAECQSLWSRVYDGIALSGTVACIPVGSSVEGGIPCRMFSSDPDSSFMDIDQLRVLGNLCVTDYNTTFGPAPDNPGWYWVNKDVMCPRLTNIDGYVNIFPDAYPRPKQINSLFGNYVTLKYHMKRSGPALTKIFNMFDHTDNFECKISVDTVFACQLDFWPPEAADWLTRTRQWPSQDVVDQISQQPCFLVHKPPSTRPEDRDKWSLSFTLAEQMLCLRRSEGMKLTYFCFKAIFYMCLHVTVDDKEFSSYMCKTVMMWALEELSPGQWTEENLFTNILLLFSKLNRHIECKYLPHYFIPDLNVMRDIPENMVAIIREIIDTDNLFS